ncbi:hypothetical protein GCM10010971_12230 [Silvimonas amylolytica]|uniref:Teneurin-like YD-shell domain-containing protein n=2 Tax=Silvimonas amylolytica TaxID=449663 RepID=A0ABQ2PJG6_9NEIS|nr:hypothetical protein GCM10010971_12230 [Silvimonas amylolytica]
MTVNNNGFAVTDGDNTETYDSTGALKQIRARNGRVLTFTYDPLTLALTQVSDNLGHKLSFQSLDAYHVNSVSTGSTSITYSFDAMGRLKAVNYPDASTRQYLYTDNRNGKLLTGIIDENGVQYAAWTYDNQDRAITSSHAGGADLVQLAYTGTADMSSRSTSETDPLGASRTSSFSYVASHSVLTARTQPAGTGSPASNEAFTYDANGNITSHTDFGSRTTTYTYDTARNLETSRTEASGTSQARTISTVWHPTFRLPTQITEPNRVSNFTYDTNGNLLTKSVTAGGKTRTWSYTYNGFGQVLTATDPDSNKTTYTYDASGNPTSLTDAASHVTQYTSYDANGNLLSMTDPNGKVSAFTWDARNRLKTRQDGSDLTTYVYDPVGQLIQVTLPDSSTVTYSYDPAHRLTGISDSRGNSITYTLDAMGNHTREDVSDPAGQLAAAQSQVATSQQTGGVMQ